MITMILHSLQCGRALPPSTSSLAAAAAAPAHQPPMCVHFVVHMYTHTHHHDSTIAAMLSCSATIQLQPGSGSHNLSIVITTTLRLPQSCHALPPSTSSPAQAAAPPTNRLHHPDPSVSIGVTWVSTYHATCLCDPIVSITTTLQWLRCGRAPPPSTATPALAAAAPARLPPHPALSCAAAGPPPARQYSAVRLAIIISVLSIL